jgi:hypothetical protein
MFLTCTSKHKGKFWEKASTHPLHLEFKLYTKMVRIFYLNLKFLEKIIKKKMSLQSFVHNFCNTHFFMLITSKND